MCCLQCTQEQLGKLYAVLHRRRAEIVGEELLEGTSLFSIEARLPVAETMGLADDLRRQTSGAISSPQLVFDRWQMLDVDPFFTPKTEEEREDFGEQVFESQGKNVAKNYINLTRQRKGLSLDKKIVVSAEKQRTMRMSKG